MIKFVLSADPVKLHLLKLLELEVFQELPLVHCEATLEEVVVGISYAGFSNDAVLKSVTIRIHFMQELEWLLGLYGPDRSASYNVINAELLVQACNKVLSLDLSQ